MENSRIGFNTTFRHHNITSPGTNQCSESNVMKELQEKLKIKSPEGNTILRGRATTGNLSNSTSDLENPKSEVPKPRKARSQINFGTFRKLTSRFFISEPKVAKAIYKYISNDLSDVDLQFFVTKWNTSFEAFINDKKFSEQKESVSIIYDWVSSLSQDIYPLEFIQNLSSLKTQLESYLNTTDVESSLFAQELSSIIQNLLDSKNPSEFLESYNSIENDSIKDMICKSVGGDKVIKELIKLTKKNTDLSVFQNAIDKIIIFQKFTPQKLKLLESHTKQIKKVVILRDVFGNLKEGYKKLSFETSHDLKDKTKKLENPILTDDHELLKEMVNNKSLDPLRVEMFQCMEADTLIPMQYFLTEYYKALSCDPFGLQIDLRNSRSITQMTELTLFEYSDSYKVVRKIPLGFYVTNPALLKLKYPDKKHVGEVIVEYTLLSHEYAEIQIIDLKLDSTLPLEEQQIILHHLKKS